MKRRVCLLIFLLAAATTAAFSQSFFSQKKTQLKYMAAQLAALKVYTTYLGEGYKIVKGGLDAYHAFKRGEFNLHNLFFKSLKNVNPIFVKYANIPDLLHQSDNILSASRKLVNRAKNSSTFTVGQIQSIDETLSGMFTAILTHFSDMADVLSSGVFEFTEDGRLSRIDGIIGDINYVLQDLTTFNYQLYNVIQNNSITNREDEFLKTLHGVYSE
ncbi:hypothetical protein [Chitinophaga eiseniae]|uniref:Type IV pili methyl-accepting chemotaxis transducer N-term n=1 Tax=Chitinophaga eiseniae TaxID=634771 RepID=A0A847SGV2_9BACT|nr:hypothetical protein [Chitinophaga eiseniae]NLR78027.1 hypothetical protein [Chitinophaga eiseniae]